MKKIIPYGNRILVKRRKIGEKIGSGILVAAQETQDRPTDLADVVYVPDHSFVDKELVSNGEGIVNELSKKAKEGSSGAFRALLEFNYYLRIKAIKVGDTVFISKYVGTDFHDTDGQFLTVVNADDVIAVVKNV